MKRLLVPIIVLSFAFVAQADAKNVSVYLKGVRCLKESKQRLGPRHDNPFLITYIKDSGGNKIPKKFPANGDWFGDIDANEMIFTNERVWSGPPQHLTINAALFEPERLARTLTKGALNTSIVSGSILGYMTGPLGRQIMIGGGVALAQRMKQELEENGNDFLGEKKLVLDLARSVKLGMDRRPSYRWGKLTYDFETVHRGDGAHYILYWEVRS